MKINKIIKNQIWFNIKTNHITDEMFILLFVLLQVIRRTCN